MNLNRVDILECGYVVDAMWKLAALHEWLERLVAAIDCTICAALCYREVLRSPLTEVSTTIDWRTSLVR